MPEVITKRKRYTIETKRKVISMMQNGASLDDAISACNAPRQTIQLWMKNSITIMSFKGSAKKKQIRGLWQNAFNFYSVIAFTSILSTKTSFYTYL